MEAFASRNTFRLAIADAFGMGAGFLFALVAHWVVFARSSALVNSSVSRCSGPNFEPWVIMILPPGGFITLGVMLLFFNWVEAEEESDLDKQLAAEDGVNCKWVIWVGFLSARC